jgi:ATP-binding cassette subfamily F protein uup
LNIINIEHLTKIYGDKRVLDDVSCGISEGEKIGIVGINGMGKTTLLRLLAQVEEADQGQIITQNGIRIGYLPQSPEYPSGVSVLSYVLEHHKDHIWEYEAQVKSMLLQMGLAMFDAPLVELSGGQKKRAALVRILLESIDVLLLDEPTNHLDEGMVDWLENYLQKFRGVVLMVTHDRYFLDRVCNRILEVDDGNLYSYLTNYSGFLEAKAQREEMERASDRKRKSQLRTELEWASRGCKARSTKQRARLERLEELKKGKLKQEVQQVEFESLTSRMGKKTIEFHEVGKTYADRVLFSDFTYIVLRMQRLGIVGPNGCGKSTLMKLIAGEILPDMGHIDIGETVKIGYFMQEVPNMKDNQRVIDYVKDIAEYIETKEGRISASQMLERFLFTPQMQYTPISKLSGGEKKRLYLLGILQAAPNCLLIDECNDLDIPTLTLLEEYLMQFPGIVITVSHDRYFLDNVVDRILAFEDGKLVQYEGGYTDYKEAKERKLASNVQGLQGSGVSTESGNANTQKTRKKQTSERVRFSYKEQREYEQIDEQIASLEDAISQVEEEMMQNASNSVKLSECMQKKEALEEELEERMQRWVYLQELAEQIALQEKEKEEAR